jgi:hypothetical protein
MLRRLLSSIKNGVVSNPLWDSLTNYYTFDNTPNDTKGTSNGTLINSLGYASCKINNGLNFNGTNNSLSLPDNFFKPSGDFSLSFWLNISNGSTTFILDIGGGQQGYADGLTIYRPSTLSLRLYIDGSNIAQFDTITDNTWYHVGLTHKTSTNYKTYLNGVLKTTLNTSKQITFPATTYGAFGSSKTATSSYSNFNAMKGDELAFFNTELTGAQMTELYNSGAGKQYPL